MFSHIASAVISAGAALLLTPLVCYLAKRLDFVDRPDSSRKTHKSPVALGGGVAVLVAILLGAMIGIGYFAGDDLDVKKQWTWWGVLSAIAVLCCVGLYDDRRPLPGKYKLLWQVVASSLIIGSGVVVESVTAVGITLNLGVFSFPLTLFWLLIAINSLNLIDGVDGLAASVAMIFSFTLGLMAVVNGQPAAAIVALSVAGALAGFLPFNLPQARIYLGDAGSMVLGLMLGALALQCSFKEAATVAFAAPLALWAIPIFDSVVAIARRKLTQRSIYATDRGHIHHRLLTRGLRPWQALAIVAGLCTITSSAALASIYFQNEAIGIGVAAVVIVALIATRVFGHVELLLLNNALVGIGRSWVPLADRAGGPRETSVQLQGTLAWEQLWEALVESAERFGLLDITLNLNAPQLHEDFYATWKHPGSYSEDLVWHVSVPIDIEGEVSGRLRVIGESTGAETATQMQDFLDFAQLIQDGVARIASPEDQVSSVQKVEQSRQQHPSEVEAGPSG